ncbi:MULTISPECIES: hypothetical protein [unclassified Paenibacillus]
MKNIFATILLLALTISAFVFFCAGGIWDDAKTMETKKDTTVTNTVIPVG